MVKMPRSLKNFNLFVEGIGYAGRIEKFTPPPINIKTDEHLCGGFDTPVTIDLGVEKLVGKMVFAEWSPEQIELISSVNSSTSIIAYGALNDDVSPDVTPVSIEMRGKITQFDAGTWAVGDKSKSKFSIVCNYLKIMTGPSVNVEIDVFNMKRLIGGVDQVEEIRAAINY